MARLEIAADPTTQSGSPQHKHDSCAVASSNGASSHDASANAGHGFACAVGIGTPVSRCWANSYHAADLAVVTHHRMWPVTHSRLLTMIEQQQKLRLCVSHASSWTVRACRYRINIEARVMKCDSTWLNHCWSINPIDPKKEGH